MPKEKSWAEIARTYVHKGYTELKTANPDMPDEQIIKKVSREYYPFGERENWPYKAWLKAVSDYRKKIGTASKATPQNKLPLFQ